MRKCHAICTQLQNTIKATENDHKHLETHLMKYKKFLRLTLPKKMRVRESNPQKTHRFTVEFCKRVGELIGNCQLSCRVDQAIAEKYVSECGLKAKLVV